MTRFQVEAPVRTFTGEVAGVAFKTGTGFVTDSTDADRAALAYFRRGGYGVTEVPEPAAPSEPAEPETAPDDTPPAKNDKKGTAK